MQTDQGLSHAAQIARIEEASLNATVVPEQQLYNGWLVRWADSAAKRARSINILAPSAAPLDERLDYVAHIYKRHDLPLIFRLTDACPDVDLQETLSQRGFKSFGHTLVMTASMRQANEFAARQQQGTWQLRPADVQTFAAQVGRLKGSSAQYIAEHALRLSSVAVPSQMLLAYHGRACVGAALGVFDGALMGIFDVISDAAQRRQGIATQLLRAQLQEGARRGISQAYLQVETVNQPARTLYARYGFTNHHQYWYMSPAGGQDDQ
ncbi:GNAT family N-acetyltransferase [Bordetella sp. FB-8]|uniref:GNAT family N-acetyltransferase n=1 Tax=Bordetella sp. FB-8 TaxID=1159870 RepID=UPI00036EE381|nr:GNAT family N-acetyltransferase [Bordetella sp. FB-8]